MITKKSLTGQLELVALFFLFVFLPLIFYLPAHDYYCTPRIWLVRVVTILVLSLTLIRSLHRQRYRTIRPVIWLPALFFLAVTAVSTFSSLHLYTSFFGEPVFFYGLVNILNGIVLFFLLLNVIQDGSDQIWLTCGILLGSAVVAGYAVCQRFELPFPNFYFKLAMFDPQRVDSTFGNPAFLSLYLMLILPLAFYQFVRSGEQKTALSRRGFTGWLVFLLVGSLLLAVLATYSRAAWIGLAVESILLVIAYKSKWKLTLLLKTGAIIAFAWLVFTLSTGVKTPSASERLASVTHAGAFQGRQAMWRYSLPMLKDYSLSGTGPGTFRYAFYRDYIPLNWVKVGEAQLTVVEPHNYFLQLACEHGIFGLLAFLWVVISFFWTTIRRSLAKNSDDALLSVCLAIGVAGFLVVAATTMQDITDLTFFWVFLALSVWSGKSFTRKDRAWKLTPSARAAWSAGIILAALGLFILATRYAQADIDYEAGAKVARSKAFQYLDLGSSRLNMSIADFPYNSEVYRTLGDLYFDAFKQTGSPEHLETAITAFTQAVTINPYDYEAFSALGNAYLFASRSLNKPGSLEQSRQVFLDLSSTRFDRPYSHYMLGRIYAEEGNLTAAITEWKTSLQLDPKYPAPYLGLGMVYQQQGDIDRAVLMYRKALKIDADDPAVKELGRQLGL